MGVDESCCSGPFFEEESTSESFYYQVLRISLYQALGCNKFASGRPYSFRLCRLELIHPRARIRQSKLGRQVWDFRF